jgi:thioredoxin-related protein
MSERTKGGLAAIVALLLLTLTQSAWAQERGHAEELAPGLVNPGAEELPAWFTNSFLDLGEDVAEAAAADKRVLLYFYQDGCPYCKKLLQDNLGQRDIAQYTEKHFSVIAINIWGDREVSLADGTSMSEKTFAAALKVMYTPTLLFLNEQGAAALRVNGYYAPTKFQAALAYVAERTESKQSFRDFYAARSPRAESGKLHHQADYLQPPYRLHQRSGQKPLLVLFEQRQCADCDELHTDILPRKMSVDLLRQFDVVLLDMWSDTPVTTPGGKTRSAKAWAHELNIQHAPSMVFFDAAGEEVFRSEAYLRAFHTQSAMEYVASGAYAREPSFQRFVAARGDRLREQGMAVELMD